MMKTALPFIVFLFFNNAFVFSQFPEVNIAFITDDSVEKDQWFEKEIQKEIIDLLSSRYEINFIEFEARSNSAILQSLIDQAFNDPKVDVVIGTGLEVSNILSKQKSFPKPVIASIVIDNELQNIPQTDNGTSGVNNFTYVHSPFNLLRDLNTLYDIYPFKKLGIIGGENLRDNILDANAFYNKLLSNRDADFVFVKISNSVKATMAELPQDVDAVYLLPAFDELDDEGYIEFFDSLAARKLPNLSLLSSPMLEFGAYASYDSGPTLQKIPRRIALNTSKVLEGINASTLPIEISTYTENLIVNMKAVNKVDIFPSWEILTQATVINMNQVDTDREINLRTCIAEALNNNLTLKIAQKETALVERDVAIAKSDYLPQLDFSSTGIFLDKNTVENSFGLRGEFTWTASGNLTQIILSEPALANIAIQKLLYETQQFSQDATELDIVLDVAEAYFGVLLSEAFVDIQRENVSVTRKNYEISLTKEAVGYAGTTDVYRWESQLALNKIDLNDSYAQLKQARFNLNQILNRPIKEAFITNDSNDLDNDHFEAYAAITELISSPSDLEIYADFMVNEAFLNLPEIKQLEKTIAIQERTLKSNKRAYYLPSIGFSGQYDYDLQRIGAKPLPGQEVDIFPVWNAAFSLQLPIFQGNSRNRIKQQTEIQIMQTEDNLADLRNKLELQVRSTMETARASYSNWQLSTEAAIASRKKL